MIAQSREGSIAPCERRQHRRIRKKLLIRIRAVKGSILADRSDTVASIENISRGGLSLLARSGYPVGMILRL